ncbi:MAG TPA: Replication factor C small subunit, partial [Thermoplasmata archaeon]|nr:Replication factor C small subunit [Thermoplasmata archaeon]
LTAAAGDLRRAENLLQLAATYADPVTESTVRETATVPLQSEIERLLETAVSGDFVQARDRLTELFVTRGASGEDILRAIHSYLPKMPERVLNDRQKVDLIVYLGEVDFRLAQGATERIQLGAVLAHLAGLGANTPKR